ncbi:hypothetical protein HPB50_023384 [Hyalomma asiaticum]|uniref:Uncharacterized protein n=1 Tax=Hyalomma asiaticum TaxID=266040 RepID=A0ACB7SIB1_HYAAI|nr:hypothetical protein HPB50_023384 [Hyalomma asiaticum]
MASNQTTRLLLLTWIATATPWLVAASEKVLLQRKGNLCAYRVIQNVTCRERNGTEVVQVRTRPECLTGDCSVYTVPIRRPVYVTRIRMQQRVIWGCCPEYSGPACTPGQLPELPDVRPVRPLLGRLVHLVLQVPRGHQDHRVLQEETALRVQRVLPALSDPPDPRVLQVVLRQLAKYNPIMTVNQTDSEESIDEPECALLSSILGSNVLETVSKLANDLSDLDERVDRLERALRRLTDLDAGPVGVGNVDFGPGFTDSYDGRSFGGHPGPVRPPVAYEDVGFDTDVPPDLRPATATPPGGASSRPNIAGDASMTGTTATTRD